MLNIFFLCHFLDVSHVSIFFTKVMKIGFLFQGIYIEFDVNVYNTLYVLRNV